MKTVFVLIGDMGYDGQYLAGVYSTAELANEAFEKLTEKKFLDCCITEKEIDADAHIVF